MKDTTKNTTVGGCSPAPVYSGQMSGPERVFCRGKAVEAYRLMAESGSVKADEAWAKMSFWAKVEGIALGIALTAAIVGAVIAIKIGIGG